MYIKIEDSVLYVATRIAEVFCMLIVRSTLPGSQISFIYRAFEIGAGPLAFDLSYRAAFRKDRKKEIYNFYLHLHLNDLLEIYVF